MFKKIAVYSFLAVGLIACRKAAPQPNASVPENAAVGSPMLSGHSQGDELNDGAPQNSTAAVVPKSATRTKWKQDGTPIDTSEFDREIARAEKDLRAKPKDEAARKALAEAYLKRGLALTDARQYAASLGDYRRVLKYDRENEEAKKWIDMTVNIYDGMNKESPKEGEEPPPLPFKKGT